MLRISLRYKFSFFSSFLSLSLNMYSHFLIFPVFATDLKDLVFTIEHLKREKEKIGGGLI